MKDGEKPGILRLEGYDVGEIVSWTPAPDRNLRLMRVINTTAAAMNALEGTYSFSMQVVRAEFNLSAIRLMMRLGRKRGRPYPHMVRAQKRRDMQEARRLARRSKNSPLPATEVT